MIVVGPWLLELMAGQVMGPSIVVRAVALENAMLSGMVEDEGTIDLHDLQSIPARSSSCLVNAFKRQEDRLSQSDRFGEVVSNSWPPGTQSERFVVLEIGNAAILLHIRMSSAHCFYAGQFH